MRLYGAEHIVCGTGTEFGVEWTRKALAEAQIGDDPREKICTAMRRRCTCAAALSHSAKEPLPDSLREGVACPALLELHRRWGHLAAGVERGQFRRRVLPDEQHRALG